LYADYWSSEPMKFHFINVPVKVGQAWVFPVGLPDAIWFVFRNPNISISTWPSVDAVFQTIPTASTHEKIFEFSGTGDVIERYTLRDSK
ncbi:MAG: hypothetical protein Q8Q49_05495, partial [bacterium]|nr:hypothetical protein [bacterium]